MKSAVRRAVAVCAVVVFGSAPARAVFHQAVIDEVMSGCGADATMQYVEIRMLQDNQGQVSGSRLRAFSCDGTSKQGLALLSMDLTNAMAGGRWIIASSTFQAASGIQPDYLITDTTPGIFPGCGMICWGKPSVDIDDPSEYVDCLAYGPYTGPSTGSAPVDSVPNTGAQSLTRSGGSAFDNAFALAAPTPTNAMNEPGNLSGCTPVTSTTTSSAATTTSSTSSTTTVTAGTTSTTVGPGGPPGPGAPPVLGGGGAKTDCFAEWSVVGAAGTAPVVRCTDDDPACDQSPAAGCVVRVQLCFGDAAAAIYGGKCTAAPVTGFALAPATDAATLAAVAAALQALPGAQPATYGASFVPPLAALTCTAPIDISVPLKVKNGKPKKGSRTLRSVATAGKRDKDKLKILCVP